MPSVKDVIFSPDQIATLGQSYLDFRRTHKESGVVFPVKKVASYLYPLLPGEVMSIIARPGHGKTGVMMYWARQRAEWLQNNGFPKRLVVYATWEQSIEELHAFHIAATKRLSVTKMAQGALTEEEWASALASSAKRIELPLWFVGHSVMRRAGRPGITIEMLSQALQEIQSWSQNGFEIDCVFIDYLQRIYPEKAESQTVAYSKIFDDIKNTMLAFGCPGVVGVQASREVEALSIPIPEINHGQWTSNVEQTSDRVMSLTRPARYRQDGEVFDNHLVEGRRQLLMFTLKQKLGDANIKTWVDFDPVYNSLDELEIKNKMED